LEIRPPNLGTLAHNDPMDILRKNLRVHGCITAQMECWADYSPCFPERE